MSFAPSSRTSSAITLIRPLLIACIMLAHLALLNSDAVLQGTAALNFDDWMTVFLKSTLAKSGVPLLSLISGYLAVRSLRQYGLLMTPSTAMDGTGRLLRACRATCHFHQAGE